MKKFISIILTIALVIVACPAVFAEENEELLIIQQYWNMVNSEDWYNWKNLYSPAVKEEYEQLISNENNFTNNVGILTVSSASVVSISQVAYEDIPSIYSEWVGQIEDDTICDYYVVDVQLSVNADNGFFTDGINSFLFAIEITENNSFVYAVSSWKRNKIKEDLGFGFMSYAPEPDYITVKYENGTIETISLWNFVFNVTCNEIGNMGYNRDALNANALAIKMCGWWAVEGNFYLVGGYHIPNGKVNIKTVNDATYGNQLTIQGVVAYIMDYEALSSNDKLFYMAYQAGSYNSNKHPLGGQLMQNGSNYLATELGWDWKHILHYYYDYTSYNNTGVGEIHINP